MSGAHTSSANISAHAGEGAWVICHTYPDTSPILRVVFPGVSLSISLADRKTGVSEQAVTFARELARSVEQFEAEVERLYRPDSAQSAA
ncbi:MAG TPA: hypothetical protein VGS19_15960 [Streptosporangiaceae bacterium]|nr:hypothetical protein [Streptosporangiaceae bacterium]